MENPKKSFLLGDTIKSALSAVGVTEERVTSFLGRPCGCPERRAAMNRLSLWAARVLKGKTDDAEKYLDEIIEQPLPERK